MPKCVLLIVIDCLRADHVSAYGYPRSTTPTLDRLAEQGVLWENAYSTSSWTKPAAASMLTGLYPIEHGAFEGIKRSKGRYALTTDALDPSRPTLAERFAEHGYRCGAFINNAQLDRFSGLDRGFHTYIPNAGKADRLIELFDQWLVADAQTPAFAYLHFLEAHWPYKPRRRHVELFGGNRDKNRFSEYSARDYGRLRRAISRNQASLAPGALEEMMQMYDAAVRRLDGKVKIILTLLDKLAMRDDATIFVTGDHGEEFLEHGMIGHGQSLYQELIHVPLIGVGPGLPAGHRIDHPVSLVDLAETLLATAGINDQGFGSDLLSDDLRPRPPVAELRIRRRYTQTLVSGTRKIHRYYTFDVGHDKEYASMPIHELMDTHAYEARCEIYDLAADPAEQINLAAGPMPQPMSDSLAADLDRWWHQTRPASGVSVRTEVHIDAEVANRLRSLGYID